MLSIHSCFLKSEYVKTNGFGGAMVWAMGLDDFKGRCGDGKYPLLKEITDVLTSENDCTATTSQPPSVTTVPTATEASPTVPTVTQAPTTIPTIPPATTVSTPSGGGPLVCVATGPWTGQISITNWCNDVCNNADNPYCPESHCKCSN